MAPLGSLLGVFVKKWAVMMYEPISMLRTTSRREDRYCNAMMTYGG